MQASAGRRLAVLHGQAVGDALGAGTEFQSPEQIATRYGRISGYVPGSPFGFAPGEFTDDTQMVLCTLAGYRTAPQGGQPLLQAVADEFADWLRSSPPDVGCLTGNAISGFPDGLDAGLRAWEASGFHSAGNGGLMRASASVIAGRSGEALYHDAVILSALTHADPRSLAASLVLVRVLEALLEGMQPPAAWDDALAVLARYPLADTVSTSFGETWRAPTTQRAHAAVDEVRAAIASGLRGDPGTQSGYVISTLQSAAWASVQPDFLDAVSAIAMRGADSDTAGAVAGAVVAARGALPPMRLVEGLHCDHRWRRWSPPGSASALETFVP